MYNIKQLHPDSSFVGMTNSMSRDNREGSLPALVEKNKMKIDRWTVSHNRLGGNVFYLLLAQAKQAQKSKARIAEVFQHTLKIKFIF
jgi:hypothetical protein